MAWGLVPLLFAGAGVYLRSDRKHSRLRIRWCGAWRRPARVLSQTAGVGNAPIVAGMWLQASALGLIAFPPGSALDYPVWFAGAILLGFGTALAYPTLLATIGDVVHPAARGSAVGVYRFGGTWAPSLALCSPG